MLFLSGLRWQNRATAGGHMQPVRGTLPSDRRKSCPVLAGLQQPLGSRRSGGLGESEPLLPRLQALCLPHSCRSRGLPPQLLAPKALPLPRRCRIQRCYRQKPRGSLAFILYRLQNAYESPLLLGLCPDGNSGPFHSLESFSSAS